MTNNENVQAAATGCLSRVFTLVGLFWAGAIAFGVLRNLDSGFDTDLTGAIFPALAFLFAGNVMRRRAREARSRADNFSAPTTPTGTHRATTKPKSVEAGQSPTPYVPSSREPAKKKQPDRPVPELPALEPAPDPGKLPAIESLEISDFEPGKALSSEERIRLARQKYSKKKPPTDPR
ncbi:hypothetical protein BH23ACT4_BH23ACT4_09690 [soil metagenome]